MRYYSLFFAVADSQKTSCAFLRERYSYVFVQCRIQRAFQQTRVKSDSFDADICIIKKKSLLLSFFLCYLCLLFYYHLPRSPSFLFSCSFPKLFCAIFIVLTCALLLSSLSCHYHTLFSSFSFLLYCRLFHFHLYTFHSSFQSFHTLWITKQAIIYTLWKYNKTVAYTYIHVYI